MGSSSCCLLHTTAIKMNPSFFLSSAHCFSLSLTISLSISLSVRPHYLLVSNIWSPTTAHSKPPTIWYWVSSCFSCLPSRTIFILGPRASFLSLSCHIPLYLISHIQLSFPIFLSFSCNLSLIHISLSLLSPVHTGCTT